MLPKEASNEIPVAVLRLLMSAVDAFCMEATAISAWDNCPTAMFKALLALFPRLLAVKLLPVMDTVEPPLMSSPIVAETAPETAEAMSLIRLV